MPGYTRPGSTRRRNPYRVSRSKAGITKRERLNPKRRLFRVVMAMKRFEARFNTTIPDRHWEECDLPGGVPPEALAAREAAMSEYAQGRRARLRKLLIGIKVQAGRESR